MRSLLIVIAMLLLSSCSVFAPVADKTTYLIDTVPSVIKTRTRPVTIVVAMPETVPVYNTTEMAYTRRPYQIGYFALNRWAETPSEMLQPLLVQSLQNTHFFRAVLTSPYIGNRGYVLNTQIIRLIQDYTFVPARVELTLRVQLFSSSSSRILGTKELTVYEPIIPVCPYSGVLATNRATARALQEVTRFVIARLSR